MYSMAKKKNFSVGYKNLIFHWEGVTPISLFDSLTGIQEVRNALNRLEYGNLA
ncbi:MbcA/ParS/Xre antitoxin family protein [Salegentibacter sp. 24]|uniref:MbcA/ParS/Xre antitoxin family protein n=1 Tax=Salegentibacter sp. 24 TaxID=2183986 RepID=UPI002938DD46|nr:MbcA/ParS/Xre antitoxin family protein [Salegentibacter sp. 24]